MAYNYEYTQIIRMVERIEKTATGGDYVAAQILLTTLRHSALHATDPRTIALLRKMERFVSAIGDEPLSESPAGDTHLAATASASLIREFVRKHGG